MGSKSRLCLLPFSEMKKFPASCYLPSSSGALPLTERASKQTRHYNVRNASRRGRKVVACLSFRGNYVRAFNALALGDCNARRRKTDTFPISLLLVNLPPLGNYRIKHAAISGLPHARIRQEKFIIANGLNNYIQERITTNKVLLGRGLTCRGIIKKPPRTYHHALVNFQHPHYYTSSVSQKSYSCRFMSSSAGRQTVAAFILLRDDGHNGRTDGEK